MRRALAAFGLAAVVLAGCVKKEEGLTTLLPVLVAEDGAGAPDFKDGVWAGLSPECSYNPNKPETEWPDCVPVMIVRGQNLARGSGGASMPYVLAGGDPRLLQTHTAGTADQPEYEYAGVRAAAFDAQRRIVRVRMWTVYCPAEPAGGEATACAPTNTAELRALAKASEELGAAEWIWVRETTR